jgi:hypothetical protein
MELVLLLTRTRMKDLKRNITRYRHLRGCFNILGCEISWHCNQEMGSKFDTSNGLRNMLPNVLEPLLLYSCECGVVTGRRVR